METDFVRPLSRGDSGSVMTGFVWAMVVLAVCRADAAAAQASEPSLVPFPRNVAWLDEPLPLGGRGAIVAPTAEVAQVGRVLAAEMQRLHGIDWPVVAAAAELRPRIVLALADSSEGRARLARLSNWFAWPPPKNSAEGYLLSVSPQEAIVVGGSPRGVLYGCQTLLELIETGATTAASKQIHGVRIADYPELAFRGVHICIFPNTELAAVRQCILLAARYKLNAVVIEPWASLKSQKHPETAYEHAYTPAEIQPLVDLGRALGMDMIPMLNSWGHASGMRSTSSEHAVLDRFPQFKPLYEPDGWSFCLSNPAIYGQLCDRYDELLDLFGPVRYFHAGMDEAWGHLGPTSDNRCRGADPRQTLIAHLRRIHGYFAQRKIQVLMWHDMFIQRDHPQLGRLSPAGSVPPINTHLALDELPKDVIIACWNYGETREWPVPKYFHDKGYPVVVCPWKMKKNTASLLGTAKRLGLLGMLTTTWDSLDVSLPSVAQAGTLAWTPLGYDLNQVPFDHWLGEIRRLPITALPALESTLVTPPEK